MTVYDVTISVTTQVHGSGVHGSRLEIDEDSKISTSRSDEHVLLFVDSSTISRNMKNARPPIVNLEP